MMNRLQRAAEFIATVGYAGRFPYAPGTVGSFIAVLLWWFLLADAGSAITFITLLLLVPLAVWSAGRSERTLGHDAHPIIIDEVAGQWLALTACPKTYLSALAAFLLFRLFDIWKPFPINKSQQLPGGFGIVIDDLLAGGFAFAVLAIIYHFGIR